MLPVLVEVYSVEGCLRTEIFPENVGDVAGAAGVGFYEDDFVTAEDRYVACMLGGGDVSLDDVKRRDEGGEERQTMFDISAETFKLPIEIPEPTWLQTKFSTSA